MKERPILMNGEMVRAILAGRKTQTRRLVKHDLQRLGDGEWYAFDHKGINYRVNARHTTVAAWAHLLQFCPYGQPANRLWVREAWRIGAWDCDIGGIAVDYCDAQRREWLIPFATKTEEPHEVFERLWIDCCDELAAKGIQHDSDGRYNWKAGESPLRWRPSIHMPRWASRINLEITGVRVERLNDISEADAIAEGTPGGYGAIPGYGYSATPVEHFRHLWESLAGPGSWAANPWVWVVEFRRVEA